MKTLRLNLKAQWYNMIESEEKKEEYREIKDYWIKRLLKNSPARMTLCLKLNNQPQDLSSYYNSPLSVDFDTVTFVYGYTRRSMSFKLNELTIGKGNKNWGAPDEDVFILKLGERLQ